MNRTTLSLGFIGGGWNSAVGMTHFIAARMDGVFSVDAGVFSRHADINAQTAERWDVPADRIYRSADDLLASEAGKLDAIVVLTPTPDHAGHVVKALQSGFPVICEKAMAPSVAEAQRIVEVAKATDGFVAVTFNYTGYPIVRQLRQMIADGRLGRLTQVHVEMPQEGFARLGADGKPVVPQPWRLQDGPIPTISLDLGVHLHHLIQFLTAERPLEVMAVQGAHGNFPGVIDNVMCLARYSGEIDSSYWFSKSALGHRNGLQVRVYGTKGSAEWRQTEPETLLLHDSYGQRTVFDRASIEAGLASEARYTRFKAGHPAGFVEAFANLYDDIGQALANRRQGLPWRSEFVFDAMDALEGLATLEAMAVSTTSRAWTPVPSRADLEQRIGA